MREKKEQADESTHRWEETFIVCRYSVQECTKRSCGFSLSGGFFSKQVSDCFRWLACPGTKAGVDDLRVSLRLIVFASTANRV